LLPTDVIHVDEAHLLLKPVEPGEVVGQLPQQGLTFIEEIASSGVIAAACRQMAHDSQD